jgi:hypothetical protein
MSDDAGRYPYEALDSAAMVVRDAKRRGAGWLAGYADIEWSNRLGWYEDFKLLVAVSPKGVITTGFGLASASTADQPLAETFFASRRHPNPLLASVGCGASGCYVPDKGFEGVENHLRWLHRYGAWIIHPPKRNSRLGSWPKRLRRWLGGWNSTDHGDGLGQDPGHVRPSPGTAPRAQWRAGSSGSEGSAAQFLYLDQWATRSSWVVLRRLLARMVLLKLTPSV